MESNSVLYSAIVDPFEIIRTSHVIENLKFYRANFGMIRDLKLWVFVLHSVDMENARVSILLSGYLDFYVLTFQHFKLE